MAKTTKLVEWYDEDNVDSWLLVQGCYKLKMQPKEYVDKNTVMLEVVGEKSEVERFESDVDDGEVEPLSELSRKNEFDEDYEDVLNTAVNEVKKELANNA